MKKFKLLKNHIQESWKDFLIRILEIQYQIHHLIQEKILIPIVPPLHIICYRVHIKEIK